MAKLAEHPWYATLTPAWSRTFVVFAAVTFYCFILGAGLWIANSLFDEGRPEAWFVIAATAIAAILWTKIVIGMVAALKKAQAPNSR